MTGDPVRVLVEIRVVIVREDQPSPHRDDAMTLSKSESATNGCDESAPVAPQRRYERRGWPPNATGSTARWRQDVDRLAHALMRGEHPPGERTARHAVLKWRDSLLSTGMTEESALQWIELAMIVREAKPPKDWQSAIGQAVAHYVATVGVEP